MSSPEPGARSRPLRIAGLALLGLSVGALLVGLITLGSQHSGGGGSAKPPAGSTSAGPSASAPGGNSAGQASATAGAPASPAPPPATTAAPPPAQPPPAPAATAPVRVYNNSTISGLAAQAADDFRRGGWPVVAVSNYPNARIPTSTVYFRPGTGEEAPAQLLGTRFNLRVEPRFEGIVHSSPGLIVIVTNDYGSK